MNKAELIERLTERLGTDRKTATAAVEGFVDLVVRAVHNDESVTITGFGVFEKRERAPRVARNPRTGETVKVKATKVPAFRPGAQFKAIIAGQQKLSPTGVAVKRGSGALAVPTAAKKAVAGKTAAKKTATKKGAVTEPAKSTVKKTSASEVASKAASKKSDGKKSDGKKADKKSDKKASSKRSADKKAVDKQKAK